MSLNSVSRIKCSQRVKSLSTDVWTIFTGISLKYNTINLGQGFMGFPAPEFVKANASEAIKNDLNQYAPPKGLPSLRLMLAKQYTALLQREIDQDKNVVVTTGANEGIFSIIAAFINPGDEVILFEPFFDQYLPNIEMNGGVPIYSPLKIEKLAFGKNSIGEHVKIDYSDLKNKITTKTKMLVLNTPQNPIGKVFSREELIELGEFAEKHDLIILSDDVYDRLYYEQKHVYVASLKNFWDRTLTVGSAGKSFGVTGWRIGWVIGNEELIKYVLGAHTRICFCTNTPMQEAISKSFEQSEINNFFENQIEEYKQRRDVLTNCLDAIDVPYILPEGSYFILANLENLSIPIEELKEVPREIIERGKCYVTCYWIAKTTRVTVLPSTAFYSDGNMKGGENYVRLAFCKSTNVLSEASQRLMKLKRYINSS